MSRALHEGKGFQQMSILKKFNSLFSLIQRETFYGGYIRNYWHFVVQVVHSISFNVDFKSLVIIVS